VEVRASASAESGPHARDDCWTFTFVKTPIFIFEGALLSLLASLMHSPMPANLVASVLAVWICVYSLTLIVEAIVWYIVPKEYALVWDHLKIRDEVQRTSQPDPR
jgi:hypothetical protein